MMQRVLPVKEKSDDGHERHHAAPLSRSSGGMQIQCRLWLITYRLYGPLTAFSFRRITETGNINSLLDGYLIVALSS